MSKRDYSTNADHIIVLDKEPSGLIKRKIPIPSKHEDYIDKFKIMAEDENLTFAEFLDTVENDEFWNSTLKKYFRHTRNYSSYEIAWDGINTYGRHDLRKYLNLAEHCHFLEKYSADNKSNFLNEIKTRILALKLQELYEESDNLIKEGKRILYSHRKEGWNFPEFNFNENFSAGIETNFGFGYSSFFYTILKYKGLKIIPYLRLVEYPYTNEFHFCYYTKSFRLSPDEWEPAIDYCLESFSLALNDEEKFINDFIIKQAKEMVERLEFIIKNEEFTFRKFDGSYYKEVYTGPKLISFRVEKISHALLYIESIREFEKTLNTGLFSEKIIPLNRELYSVLLNEIEFYNKELSLLEAQKELAEKEYSDARKSERNEDEYLKRFKEEFSNTFSKELYTLLFSQNQYNHLWQFIESRREKESIYDEIKNKYNYLEREISIMEKGKQRIEEYFEKHELSLEAI